MKINYIYKDTSITYTMNATNGLWYTTLSI